MTDTVSAWIPGIPKGQPRQRHWAKLAGGKVVSGNYDPGTADDWKASIVLALRDKMPAEPWTGPVELRVTYHMPRPKSHYRTGKHAGVLRSDAPFYHDKKPDRDNLNKALMDTCTQLGLWRDDCQVCAGPPLKIYASGQPGCEFVAKRLFP